MYNIYNVCMSLVNSDGNWLNYKEIIEIFKFTICIRNDIQIGNWQGMFMLNWDTQMIGNTQMIHNYTLVVQDRIILIIRILSLDSSRLKDWRKL